MNAPTRPDRPLDASPVARRLLSDTVRYAVARIVPALVGVATLLVATRVLDADDYGKYALVLATALLVSTSLFAWLRQAIFRFVPRYQRDGTLGAALPQVTSLVLLTHLASALVAAAILVLQGLPSHLVLFGALLVVALIAYSYYGTLQQALLRSNAFILLSATQAGLQGLLLVAFLHRPFRAASTLVLILVASNLASVIWYARLARAEAGGRFCRAPARALTSDFLAYGLPMIGWFFVTQVLNVADRYVIGALRGDADVGLYSASYNLASTAFALLTMPLLVAMHPLVIQVWEQSRESAETSRVLERTVRMYMAGSLPILAFAWVMSADVVHVALGPEFWSGSPVFPVVTLGLFASGLSNYAHKGLELHNRTTTMFYLAAASALVNVALNLLLVPAFGYMAAAWTAVASQWLYLILAFACASRYLKWSLWSASAAKSLACSVVAAGAVVALRRYAPAVAGHAIAWVVGAGALFAIVYAVGLLASGVVGRDALTDGFNELRASVGSGKP